MDAGEIIALAAILVGILLSIIVFVWQTHSQNSRLEAKIDAQSTSLRAEMDAQSTSLRAEMRALSDRLGVVESRLARFEGINETLSQILRQQSHTHESDD